MLGVYFIGHIFHGSTATTITYIGQTHTRAHHPLNPPTHCHTQPANDMVVQSRICHRALRNANQGSRRPFLIYFHFNIFGGEIDGEAKFSKFIPKYFWFSDWVGVKLYLKTWISCVWNWFDVIATFDECQGNEKISISIQCVSLFFSLFFKWRQCIILVCLVV